MSRAGNQTPPANPCPCLCLLFAQKAVPMSCEGAVCEGVVSAAAGRGVQVLLTQDLIDRDNSSTSSGE